MKPIVVPLDGSKLAEQALPLAATLARVEDAVLIPVTAIVKGDRWVDDGFLRRWESEEQAAIEEYQRSIIDRLRRQSLRVKGHLEWGRPEAVIESIAVEESAGLIVMTTHGRSGVSRWTLGSVADKLLRTTSTPLILIHPTTQARVPRAIRRIAVALDGTQFAEGALPEAEQLARTVGASLLLARVVVPPAALYGAEFMPGSPPMLEKMEAEARDYLEHIAEEVRERGLEVDTAAALGVPADAILAAARDNKADLIAMTTHGRTGLDRWLFGSVTDAVVRQGELPVLAVRTWLSAEEEEAAAIPLAGNAVVPPPVLEETVEPLGAKAHSVNGRAHRPERTPGR
jgi:nucleotide-binding universal stress UspA family protein